MAIAQYHRPSQGEAAALQKTLEETLARFDEVQAQTATVEEEVVDEVRLPECMLLLVSRNHRMEGSTGCARLCMYAAVCVAISQDGRQHWLRAKPPVCKVLAIAAAAMCRCAIVVFKP